MNKIMLTSDVMIFANQKLATSNLNQNWRKIILQNHHNGKQNE